MIRIAILDDEEIYREKEKKITEDYFANIDEECQINVYGDAEWFLLGLKEEAYDIYVLDIDMPKKMRIDVAREIRMLYPDPVIIFATNYVDYAVEAYEVETHRFIPKQMLEKKLPGAYEAALSRVLEREELYYVIEKGNTLEKIPYDDILYLKKEGKYTIFVRSHGTSRVRESLTAVCSEMNAKEICMVDKSYAVNIKHVMQLHNQELLLRNGVILPVGKPRVHQVMQALSDYWKRG